MPNTQNQTNENPLGFAENSTKHKIYHKYFVLQITNVDTIATELGLSSNTVKTQLYHIKKLMQSGTRVPEIATQLTNANQVLEVSVKSEGDDLFLNIKSCKEFEDWLIANKEAKVTQNLFGQGAEGKYYYLRIVENTIDDINSPIVCRGTFNFAVLRMVGISSGLKYRIDGLLSEVQIVEGLKKLIKAYKDFFKLKIANKKIDVKAEVLAEND